MEKETRRVREMVEATTAEARSVRGNVESHVATLAAAAADVSVARTTEEISRRVNEMVEYSDAQASHVAADVTQRLEKEIVAAATSTAATADSHDAHCSRGRQKGHPGAIRAEPRGCPSMRGRGGATVPSAEEISRPATDSDRAIE